MIEKNVEVNSNGEKVDFRDKSTYEFLFKEYWEIIKKKKGLTLDNLQEAHAYLYDVPKEHSSNDDFVGNIDDGDDEPNGSSNKVKASKKQKKSEKNVYVAANAISEDETLACSEDSSDSVREKKSRNMTFEPSASKGISERYRRCFSSLVRDNIELIYLRRSLVMDLLKQPETFEKKVIGCFVRVKDDPKYCTYNRPRTMYQLGQVTGIGRSSEEYEIKGISTNMLLRISCCWREVKISMLSDEDIEEDECEDLRLLVKQEHSERLTVAELEEKARNVHKDIVSHRIDKELQRLEKLIEVASEKGWRCEMHEYIEKRSLLHTPGERQRLLEEDPQIIPDLEDNKDTELLVAASDTSFQIKTSVLQGATRERVVCLETCSQEISKGANEKAVRLKSCSREKSEDANERAVCFKSWSEENRIATEADACTPGTCVQNQSIAVKCNASGDTPSTYAQNQGTRGSKDNVAGDRLEMHVQKKGTEVKCNAAGGTPRTCAQNKGTQGSEDNAASNRQEMDVQKKGTEVKCNAACDAPRTYAQNQGTQGSEDNAAGDRLEMHVQKRGNEATAAAGITGEVTVIDGDEDEDYPLPDEDEAYPLPDEGANITVDLDANNSSHAHMVQPETRYTAGLWFYMDPNGDKQGPVRLDMLRHWKTSGYFDDDFKVWGAGQSPDSAVLLTDALHLKR